MNHNKGIRYEFTFSEMVYLLFKKKVCPNCQEKMMKFKDYKIRTDLFDTAVGQHFFEANTDVKDYSYHYICPACKSNFSLSELAKRRG